jgi:uncharacterized protein
LQELASPAARLDVIGRIWHHEPAMVAEIATFDPALDERERVLRILHEEAPKLRALGITQLNLFGSMARGEAESQSDVDLLVNLAPDAPFGLFDLIDVQERLGERLGRTVNVAFISTLRPWLRERIEEDRIRIF